MPNLIPSTVFDDHELTKAGIWAPRVWTPVSNALTGYLGDAGWQTVAANGGFSNSWADYGSPLGSAAFRVRDGILFLRGGIKSGTTLTTVFTLPTGYRPAGQSIFLTPSGTFATPGFARIDVFANGTVVVNSYGSGGSNAYVDLSSIRIPIAPYTFSSTSDQPFAWPMTSSPLPDGTVANTARWYKEFFGPINQTKNYLDADDTGLIPVSGALLNGWVNFGSGIPGFSYRKRRGVVWVSGTVKSGSLANIGIFGEGLRPAEARVFAQAANGTGGVPGAARVQIDAAGNFTVVVYSYSGNNGYVALDGICWDTVN